jgi:hypothetical protein
VGGWIKTAYANWTWSSTHPAAIRSGTQVIVGVVIIVVGIYFNEHLVPVGLALHRRVRTLVLGHAATFSEPACECTLIGR